MQILAYWLCGLTFVVVSSLASAASAETRVTQCETIDATVRHIGADDMELVCNGAEKALVFLATIGLTQRSGIEVDLVSDFPSGSHEDAIGCYEWASHRIFLVPIGDCINTIGWPDHLAGFDDQALYMSYVAHEVAHAVFAENVATDNPSKATHEYVAAVVQLGSMNDDLRSTILSRYEGEGFDDPFYINLVLYEFDPTYFAAQSYRHFLKPENGRHFIDELISGKTKLSDTLDF